MEMERSFYVIGYTEEYFALMAKLRSASEQSGYVPDERPQPLVVSITQGGFGTDVVDDDRQVKERFLEHLFSRTGIDIPRSADDFDRYFTLEEIDDPIDLDQEA